MYMCIYLGNLDKKIQRLRELPHYCKKNGYTIAGDFICGELTAFNVFDNRQRSLFLRLQIPVSFQKSLDSHPTEGCMINL